MNDMDKKVYDELSERRVTILSVLHFLIDEYHYNEERFEKYPNEYNEGKRNSIFYAIENFCDRCNLSVGAVSNESGTIFKINGTPIDD